jgi:hypothetical protein
MAGIFTISPLNSLHFIKSSDQYPNFDNTLYQDRSTLGVNLVKYWQKVLTTDTVIIQIKTDYTAITASKVNMMTGATTALTVTLKTAYTGYSFYEISATFPTAGYYKILISGTKLNYAPVNFISEGIESAVTFELNSVTPGAEHKLIEWYNDSNTPYIDYSTGIAHLSRVFGLMRLEDIGGKEEMYNNQGIEELVYADNETVYNFTIESIPDYLVRKILYAGKLDHFIVNDIEYLVKEHSTEAINGSHLFNLSLKMTQKSVAGVNDDQDGGTYTLNATVIDAGTVIGEIIDPNATSIDYYASSISIDGYGSGDPVAIEITLMKNGVADYVYTNSNFLNEDQDGFTIPYPFFPGNTYYFYIREI